VPTAGCVVFGGYAICGDHGCPNILVRSKLPPGLERDPYDPEYPGWVTLHEIGHALGAGLGDQRHGARTAGRGPIRLLARLMGRDR